LATKCVVIESISKQSCSGAGKTRSCTTDEEYRVNYNTQTGENVNSTITTYGTSSPSLLLVNSFIVI
jgi:hypothetical protein